MFIYILTSKKKSNYILLNTLSFYSFCFVLLQRYKHCVTVHSVCCCCCCCISFQEDIFAALEMSISWKYNLENNMHPSVFQFRVIVGVDPTPAVMG